MRSIIMSHSMVQNMLQSTAAGNSPKTKVHREGPSTRYQPPLLHRLFFLFLLWSLFIFSYLIRQRGTQLSTQETEKACTLDDDTKPLIGFWECFVLLPNVLSCNTLSLSLSHLISHLMYLSQFVLSVLFFFSCVPYHSCPFLLHLLSYPTQSYPFRSFQSVSLPFNIFPFLPICRPLL